MLNDLFKVAYVSPVAGDILDPDTGVMRPYRGTSALLSNAAGHSISVTLIDTDPKDVKLGAELSVRIDSPKA